MITLRPKIASAKYSTGPNSSAKPEMRGDMKIMTAQPMMPPMNDEKSDIAIALPAIPFLHIGYPSRIVAAAAGVPGVRIRIAEMAPPYMAPV